MTSLISGCAETSANFAGGQTLRSGGLCSMSAVRQTRRNTVIWERLSKKPASLDGASFLPRRERCLPARVGQ